MGRRTSEEIRQDIREDRRKNKIPYIKVVCKKCGEPSNIRTHKPELYTKEVIEKWTCLICDSINRKGIKVL
jgi:hypothetical protein